MTSQELQNQVDLLQSKLTNDLTDENFDLMAKISLLKRQIEQSEATTPKPENSQFECFNCGS
jgi:hypothetical protein